MLPHNVDLVHQECNVTESIINMWFDVTGFSKDNVNASKDLVALCNQSSLEPKRNAKENLERPRTPYYLSWQKEKRYLGGLRN
jgi:hypothetical protein